MLASPYVQILGWEPSWKQVSEVFPINHKLCTEIDLLVSPTEPSLFLFLPEDGNRIKGSVISESFWNRCCSSFPGSSAGKESACNAGDPSLIPGLERSTGEGIGYPLQYSWASLVAQLVKNLPTMRETWVWSLGWEDPRRRKWQSITGKLYIIFPWAILFHTIISSQIPADAN